MVILKRRITGIFLVLLFLVMPFTASAEEYNCAEGVHKFIMTETPATDTQDGIRRFACEFCGYHFEEILLATEHAWGPWVIDKQAACTTTGLRHHDCTRGTPHTEHEVIKALGHDYAVQIKQPACTEKGVKTFTCNRCGESYIEEFDEPAGHSYTGEITTEPTPDTEGVKTFTCERCGDSYTEPVAKLGHTHTHEYASHSETKPACETDGIMIYTCKICGQTYSEEILAIGHDYGEWIIDKNPNLTEEGLKHKICKHDGNHIIYEKIPKAITFEITPATAATGGSALLILIIAIIILVSDYKIILWDRKNRKKKWLEIEERRKQK